MKNYHLLGMTMFACVICAIAIGVSVVNQKTALAQTSVPITVQAGVGDSGSHVSALQTFLAQNLKVYPQALVTGYFGPLTESAVRNFQIGYGISAVGRVGPLTLAKISELVALGRQIDVSSPNVMNPTVSNISSSRATVSWSTDEPSFGKVHYSPSPITGVEATQSKMQPTMSGTVAIDSNTATTLHSIPLTNLERNTTYYYAIMTTDAQGNVTVHDWNKTFRTD